MRSRPVTYPKIRGASVEVQLQSLGRSANLNLTKILRVVLLVFRSHLAGLAISGSFNELVLAAKAATAGNIGVSKATLVKMGSVVVGTRLCGLEAEAVQEIDVGFSAVRLVVLVGNGQDLLQAQLLPQLGLGCECIHDCFSGRQSDGCSGCDGQGTEGQCWKYL